MEEDQRKEPAPYEYEVDLREYFQVIWREKWLILLIFIVAAGAAYGFSTIQPAKYQTGTTLLITPRISQQLGGDQQGGLFTTNLSTTVYRESAMADDLLQSIIDQLDLKSDGDDLSVSSLEEKMKVNVELSEEGADMPQLPLVTMTVSGNDPDQIKLIANTWADLFVEKNTELLSSETARSYEFISGRFEEVSDNLNKEEEQKLQYRKEHPLELLKNQLSVLRTNYGNFLSQLQQKRAKIEEKKARLKSLNSVLEQEPQFLEMERSIPEESLWNLLQNQEYTEEPSPSPKRDAEGLSKWTNLKILDQEKNDVYFQLKSEKRSVQVDIDSLKEEITYLEKKTEEFSRKIEEKQFEIDQTELQLKQYDREISRLNKTFSTLSDNLEEARIAKEEKESSIRIMERAIKPEKPMASNTSQNVAVAGVIGLFLGVLIAFFKNYMRGYKPKGKKENIDEAGDSKN